MTFSAVAPMNYSRFIVDRFDEINKKDWKIERFVEIMFSQNNNNGGMAATIRG